MRAWGLFSLGFGSDLGGSRGHRVGLSFTPRILSTRAQALQSLLPRETTGDVHVDTSLGVRNSRDSDVC